MFLRVLLLIAATSVCFGCAAVLESPSIERRYAVEGTRGEIGVTGSQGPTEPSSGGLTYIRWGRTVCPDTDGTELVYKGRAAGSHYTQTGGGSNYQCMTENPQNFDFGPGTSQASYQRVGRLSM